MNMNTNPSVSIYISCHKDIPLSRTDILIPFRTDRTDGENIAHKSNYAELRTQYWVWKNEPYSDFIGFFHFRRYLDFQHRPFDQVSYSNHAAHRPCPYHIFKKPDASHYTLQEVYSRIQNYDVIAPVWEYTGISVRARYARSQGQRKCDLDLIYQILQTKYPSFASSADAYLNEPGEYYGNIFIMRREYFFKYCEWLFGILEEFDRRCPFPPTRTNGYLGERLFGIWLTHIAGTNAKCAEFPRAHFYLYDVTVQQG